MWSNRLAKETFYTKSKQANPLILIHVRTSHIALQLLRQIHVHLLPTAYVVREEVMFSLCSHLGGGGGYPIQLTRGGGGYPISGPGREAGFPILGPGGGVPHPRSRQGGIPSQVQAGEGVPHPKSRWGRGTPAGVPPWQGTPPPAEVPPPPPRYFLRRGRYASCVHAGGLSCLFVTFSFAATLLVTTDKPFYNTSVAGN